MKKLSVEEYSKLMGVSTKTVYRRIDRGQVITCRDTVNNKEVIRVIVDDNELLSGDMSNTCQSDMSGQNETLCQKDNIIEATYSNELQSPKYLEFIEKLYNDNKELALMAGQVKLLNDSESKTKEEYFKIIQENAQLKAKVETYQEKLKTYEEKENQLKLNWWNKL